MRIVVAGAVSARGVRGDSGFMFAVASEWPGWEMWSTGTGNEAFVLACHTFITTCT